MWKKACSAGDARTPSVSHNACQKSSLHPGDLLRWSINAHREVVELLPRVGVESGLVALATTPEDVVLAAELVAHIERHLGLGTGPRVAVEVRVGGTAVHEARVREQVLRSPQKADARRLLVLERMVRDVVENLLRLGQGSAFRGDVDVVERVVVDT